MPIIGPSPLAPQSWNRTIEKVTAVPINNGLQVSGLLVTSSSEAARLGL